MNRVKNGITTIQNKTMTFTLDSWLKCDVLAKLLPHLVVFFLNTKINLCKKTAIWEDHCV